MSYGRILKGLGLALVLFATAQSVTALPAYTYCCSRGCQLTPYDQCLGAKYSTFAACSPKCIFP